MNETGNGNKAVKLFASAEVAQFLAVSTYDGGKGNHLIGIH